MSLTQLQADIKAGKLYSSTDQRDIANWKEAYQMNAITDNDVRTLIAGLVKRHFGTSANVTDHRTNFGRLWMAQDLSNRISGGRVKDIHLEYGSTFARKFHDIGKKVLTALVPAAAAVKVVDEVTKKAPKTSGSVERARQAANRAKAQLGLDNPSPVLGQQPVLAGTEQPFYNPQPTEASLFSGQTILIIVGIIAAIFIFKKLMK